jgi:phage terminase large subunit-like protein
VVCVFAKTEATIRAEPVAALYKQGRIHHVGAFPTLEDQPPKPVYAIGSVEWERQQAEKEE